jgi:dTDP-4-dehydrorhamnose reductase
VALKALVFGGSGQLGSEILRQWTDVDIVAPSSADVNVDDAASVRAAIDAAAPELVVNCTAFHNLEQCGREPERAFATNALAVFGMARACADRGAAFVTFSTDYVFSGELGREYTEHDAPDPVNAYGVSKLAGEQLVRVLGAKSFVVRTCGVYGTRVSSSKGYTFIDRVINQARAGEAVRIVRDQVVSPSYAGDIARALRELVRTERYGLYHMVNRGPVTWYDFARETLRQAGIDHPIEPVSTNDWPSTVRRPAYSALANTALDALDIPMPDWREGIAGYLRDKA